MEPTLDRKLPILVGLDEDGGSLADDIDTVSPSSDPREYRRSSFMLPYCKRGSKQRVGGGYGSQLEQTYDSDVIVETIVFVFD